MSRQKSRAILTLVMLGIISVTVLILFVYYKQEFNVSKFSTYCGLLSFIPLLLFIQFTKTKSRKFGLLGLFLLMMFFPVGLWAFVKDVDQIGSHWGYSVVWVLSSIIAVIGFFMSFRLVELLPSGDGIKVDDSVKPDFDKCWYEYGDKLKSAYRAKRGYNDTAFNQEVDNRIRSMIYNRKGGLTHTQNYDGIKRLADFAECAFDIPSSSR